MTRRQDTQLGNFREQNWGISQSAISARTPLAGFQNRCGYGPRQPLMVLSPYSNVNSVDHSIIDQTSILRFVEDNWLGGQRIGDGSFETLAGSLYGLFNATRKANHLSRPITGEPRS
jgi:phospholipase C